MISLSLLPQAERLRRMLGKDEEENKKKPKHMSADDLNDGFILDKDDRRLLSYKVSCVPPTFNLRTTLSIPWIHYSWKIENFLNSFHHVFIVYLCHDRCQTL